MAFFFSFAKCIQTASGCDSAFKPKRSLCKQVGIIGKTDFLTKDANRKINAHFIVFFLLLTKG